MAPSLSPARRAVLLALLRADRPTRIRQAVAEALAAVRPGGLARLEEPKRALVVDELTAEILAGTAIAAAVRRVLPAWLPSATPGQLTRVSYRLVFDLEGGPGPELPR